MNKALEFKNWNKGGKYYVLNATSHNKWVGFQESVIEKLKNKFNDDFYLVIWTDRQKYNDFFNIPFKKLKHLFVNKHKTTGNSKHRWTAIIENGKFLMHSNSSLAVSIKEDYGNIHIKEDKIDEQINEDLSNLELEQEFFEGEKKYRLSSYYERNSQLRIAAIKEHGFECKVCGFNFKEFYGHQGEGFIEVHHLTPVSNLDPLKKVCPINDMTVVCSNCHRMFHRNRGEILTLDQVKGFLRNK